MEPAPDDILDWYHSLSSRRVDLVGDYGGNELFLIELDSLLLHCFSDHKIDFCEGFQLLHAVYAVEKLLQDLLLRRCNFHIVCFDQNESLCVPLTASGHHTKYLLARSVLIRHLQRNLPDEQNILRRFPSFTHASFAHYLDNAGIYFVVCHDGAIPNSTTQPKRTPKAPQASSGLDKAAIAMVTQSSNIRPSGALDQSHRLRFRAMIRWFILKQYNVALINELQFLDTKAFTMVLESLCLSEAQVISTWHDTEPDNKLTTCSSRSYSLALAETLSERDAITILALQQAVEAAHMSEDEVSSFLLHIAALQFLPLQDRRLPKPGGCGIQNLIVSFTQSALTLLRDPAFVHQLEERYLPCDLADLIDGFLLAATIDNSAFRHMLLANHSIKGKFETLSESLSHLCGRHIAGRANAAVDAKMNGPKNASFSPESAERAVLPFKNPVFDKHLAMIHLRIDLNPTTLAAPSSSRIFTELTHWHNHRKGLVTKGAPPQAGWFARRRNQWLMAEMQDYAASLTNAAGKSLEPETIIGQRNQLDKRVKNAHSQQTTKEASGTKRPQNPTKKGGKAAALETAATIKAGKTQSKTNTDIRFWKAKCNEISAHSDPRVRYTLAKAYLQTLNTAELGPEIELFMIDCLLRIFDARKKEHSGVNGNTAATKDGAMTLAALIWDAYLRLSNTEVGMTQAIVTALDVISGAIGFPTSSFQPNSPDRPLAFTLIEKKQMHLLIGDSAATFQLEHCGPYFDRAIDSAPDARVPFEPDGWQRLVLDAIDEGKSLFVAAPTSAGKTFISFYAIKKVLQASDDDVVVYIAPTKALVNQIAAEIQARFSKAFKHPGRSVWSIHTRDYRVNSPTGCQVLVTVPHILQIMLLAPSHAEKDNSWSNRVKCIIFDEVHCIGQADDGVVWEQLLLQAPCPIIALSATVGNPQEFSDWLGSTQKANGNELVTIQHPHRYSNLRKFIYTPPKRFCFSGLPDPPPISTPGLDGNDGFAFVHPVTSLVNKSRGMPNDLSLEARDCLRLWQCMAKHETQQHSVSPTLHPDSALPKIIKKTDVLSWEANLKEVLLSWMTCDKSPFDKVRRELSNGLDQPVRRDTLVTQHCNEICESRDVDSNRLASMILPALADLHSQDALPGIVFSYDRGLCELLSKSVCRELGEKEDLWKENSSVWKAKVAEFEKWSKLQEAAQNVKRPIKKSEKQEGEERMSKAEREREADALDSSKWAYFDPVAPVDGFHFADFKKLPASELDGYQQQLRNRSVDEWLVSALERGIGVHHAGMNRKYRQVVEVLFRKGFLRVVIATGTLALGINMPCKTVVFAGDSVFLTALNFRQGAGRAGRRGFDMLGNVVFLGIAPAKVFRLLSSRLPDLNGHFPITTSLVLRLATLLHESGYSRFAERTIDSILSQPRLYLGSPESKVAVLHHLRFSIEYLRRQSLLDAKGAPINFAGCVSHLYYTDNAAWAFHALLSAGYFHHLCMDIDTNPGRVCLTLMLVLSHIFGRQVCKQSELESIEQASKHSSSIGFLPPLPKKAEEALQAHNAETLEVLQTYVKTYVDQHLHQPDNKLPFTQLRIGSDEDFSVSHRTFLRSPFVALSGLGDQFDTISDLCSTVRSGVFLEEAVVPHLPVSSSTPLNAYLYDFYKHGSIKALEKGNKIRPSDVWFYLNDFSLVLATLITSLTNFMNSPLSDASMMDVTGGGDANEEQQDDEAMDKQNAQKSACEGEDQEGGKLAEAGDVYYSDEHEWSEEDVGLPKVLKAFQMLRGGFDAKFKKMWA